VNVSSPNTPGLRALQARDAIEPLLKQIADARDALSPRVPVLVKIAPDLSDDEIDGIVEAARDVAFDGFIATNTTVSRDASPAYAMQWGGGLSGAPLRTRSTEIIRHIATQTRGEFPIVGVGGVSDAASALEKLRAGATLIQIFTGLIYQGPRLVREINEALLRENMPQTKLVLHPA
jgi:dihydroorotate dehydrogenase